MPSSTFAELGLSAKVLAAVETTGYSTPTPIQEQAIPVAVSGRDVLGIAQTGTGKTASFVLPMITRLEVGRARARMPRSLILAPTRELAAQCAQSFEKYGQNHRLTVALLIGGMSMDEQIQKLDRGVDVLIATPGRLLDHFQRGRLMLMGVEILVIDEADRMLDMGFIPDIEKICKLLPPRRQTLFFSATMPPEITRLVDQFLKDPVRIEVARPATTAKTITQRFRFCSTGEDWAKREILRELIRNLDVKNAIIFCNRKKDVAILLKSLTKHGFNAGALHGDMDQMSRMATLDKFRSGEITLLAASDVAARGLDIPDVSHVINFDVPWQPDDYVHRIGRTGRAGKEGFSATIVTVDDIKSVDAIANLTGEAPVWLGDPPDEDAIEESKSRRGRGRGRGAKARPEARGRGRGEMRGRSSASRPSRDRHERTEAPRETPREDRPLRRDRAPAEVRDEHRQHSRSTYGERDVDRGERDHREARSAPKRDVRRVPAPQTDQPWIEADAPGWVPARREEVRRAPERDLRTDTRERSERGRDAHHDRRPPSEDRRSAAPQARERSPSDDRREHREPERHGQHRRGQPERERGVRPGAERPPASSDRRSPERGSGGSSSPKGLGDHIPAFLRRPVRAGID